MWAFVQKSRLLFILNTKKGFMFAFGWWEKMKTAPMIFSLASAQMAFHLRLYVLYIVWVFSFTIVLHRYFYFVVVTTGRECVCGFFSFFCLDHLLFRFGFLYSLFPIRSTSSHCSHRKWNYFCNENVYI